MAHVDFMIVGQGLAGSVLSISLLKKGYSVCVIDNINLSSCSSVAAGIWNPVVFKRLTNSWLAADVVPELNEFYSTAEKLFNATFLHQRHIIKPFTEEQEKNLWLKKAVSENIFLDSVTYNDLKLSHNTVIPSYSKVLRAGNLDVISFLEHTKKYLLANSFYLNESFEHSLLKNDNGTLNYKTVSATKIIFCEGHLISQNPYFNWIPLKPAKGEVLTIHCNELLLPNDIFNKGIFILPAGNATYKVGATYQWQHLNDTPTHAAKEELIQKLNTILKVPYTIIEHKAGVRPAIIDRRPVIGEHPQLKNYYVFNGFGTKAVMLAPYFAKQFLNYFQNGQLLNAEVEPSRFK